MTENQNLSKEFKDFLQKQVEWTSKMFHPWDDPEKSAYIGLAKLMEETGELADAIRTFFGRQRQEKLPKSSEEDRLALIEEEVADTVIATLVIAKRLGIDIESALTSKIEKIKDVQKKEPSRKML